MPNEDAPFVTVTHREVWDAVRKHEQSVGDGGHTDHELRIRRLELRYYTLLAGLVTGVIGSIALAVRGILA